MISFILTLKMKLFVLVLFISVAKSNPWSHAEFLTQFLAANVSDQCYDDVQFYKYNLLNLRPWALKMYDSYGKVPIDGMLYGHSTTLGSASSCLEIHVNDTNFLLGDAAFGTRYCDLRVFAEVENGTETVEIRGLPAGTTPGNPSIFLTSRLLFGICLPDSCSPEDIVIGIKNFLETDEVTYNIFPYGCQSRSDEITHNAYDWFYISFFTLFLAIVLVATILDLAKQHLNLNIKRNLGTGLLLGFSAYTNGRKITDTNRRQGGDQLYCINGMRFLSMTWVVLCHMFTFGQGYLPWKNFFDAFPGPTNFLFEVIRNGFPSVDSFFFLSGCLLGYITFKEMDALKARCNDNIPTVEWAKFWFMFYLHRYIRLTAIYAMIVGWHAVFIPYLSDGFLKVALMGEYKFCRDYWYANLLYCNNYVHKEAQCLGQTWYLSTEMQIFVWTPLLLYPLWSYKSAGIAVAAFWSFVSMAIPFCLTWGFGYGADPSVTMFSDISMSHWNEYIYQAPWSRAGPYVVGIIVGHRLHLTKPKKGVEPYKMHWMLNIAGWLCAIGAGIGAVYGLEAGKYLEEKVAKSQLEANFWAGCHRFAWGAALGWVVFACARGYGGFVNRFLSWEGFTVVSRLTYVGYLIHMSVLFVFMNQFTFSLGFTHIFIVIMALSVVMTTIVLSFFVVILFEVPLLNVEKLLLMPRKAKTA